MAVDSFVKVKRTVSGIDQYLWIPIDTSALSGWVPDDDNLTDLGSAAFRFRDLWLGTAIKNTSNLGITLTNAADVAVNITNSGAGKANLNADGIITGTSGMVSGTGADVISGGEFVWTGGLGFNGTLRHANTVNRVYTFPNLSGDVLTDTEVKVANGANDTVVTSAATAARAAVFPDASGDICLTSANAVANGAINRTALASLAAALRTATFPDKDGTVAMGTTVANIPDPGAVPALVGADTLDLAGLVTYLGTLRTTMISVITALETFNVSAP